MHNHSFDVSVATEYKSIEIAVLVWHFQYWIMKNKRLGKNEYEGRTWTYQTYMDIVAIFPYWSRDQIKRLLKKLVRLNILITGNFNKTAFDQTVWYAFSDEHKFGISQVDKMEDVEKELSSIGRNRPIDKTKSPNGMDEIALPIPNTLTNTLTNKDIPHATALENIAKEFFRKIRTINSKIKPPNFQRWAKELELLSKDGEGTSLEQVEKVIDYVISTKSQPTSNGFCWADVILSPGKLRKHFPKLWGEIETRQSDFTLFATQKNEKMAKNIFMKFRTRKDIVLGNSYLEFQNGQTCTYLKFDEKNFREKCLHELKKRNLKMENL